MNYRKLLVWQKSVSLVRRIYRETDPFPERERFGLTAQMRDSAISIPSNIAEGQGRLTGAQCRHFFGNSRGSLYELETQITIAREVGYLNPESEQELLAKTNEIGRMLNGLISRLRSAPKSRGPR